MSSTKMNGYTNGTNGSNSTNGNSQIEPSNLSKIESPSDNPYELFHQWFQDAKNSHLVLPQALVLSTSTKDGKVSSRTLLLRRLEEDGFVLMTDNRSRKHAQINENKNAALVFLWLYKTEDGTRCINRQVRVEGELEVLTSDRFEDLYEKEPIYCKIRAHLCHQDQICDWDVTKTQHDQMYDQYKNGVKLPMPDHFIAYKMHPTMIEFYHAYTNEIGDRIHYSKSENSTKNIWKRQRIFA